MLWRDDHSRRAEVELGRGGIVGTEPAEGPRPGGRDYGRHVCRVLRNAEIGLGEVVAIQRTKGVSPKIDEEGAEPETERERV